MQEPLLEHKGKSTERLKNSILGSECQTLIICLIHENTIYQSQDSCLVKPNDLH